METKPDARFTRSCSAWYVPIFILSFCVCYRAVAQSEVEGLSGSSATVKVKPVCDPQRATRATHNANRRNLKTRQEEWELGKDLAAEAEQNAVLISDNFIVHYLNELEQKIVSRSDLPGCFVVKVLVDPEPNAYSFPGGFIYVTTGLIEILDSEGELASALAHETGHITARHMTRLLTRSRHWGRAAFLGGPAGYLVHRYVGPLVMFSLIRRDEFEADRLGLQYEVAAGYDSLDFCSLLQRAIPQSGKGASLLDRLYDAHPATTTRVKRLTFLSRRMPPPKDDHLENGSEFQQMKTQFALTSSHRS